MVGEISYDLVMMDDMDFVEGCYRLPEQPWQVLIISKRNVRDPQKQISTWESGATGLVIIVPTEFCLNQHSVESLLTRILGIKEWQETRGPDSMSLR